MEKTLNSTSGVCQVSGGSDADVGPGVGHHGGQIFPFLFLLTWGCWWLHVPNRSLMRCLFFWPSVNHEWHKGVRGGQPAHHRRHLRRRHRRQQRGPGGRLLPPALPRQEETRAAESRGGEEDRQGGEAGAAQHPSVPGGLRLRLPGGLRPRDLQLQLGRH